MALQAIKGGAWIPHIYPTGGLAFLSLLMDASAEKVACVFRVPKTGTLDKFEFRVGTVSINAASQVRCSFQDVSATNGDPDGTQDQYRNIAGSSFASNTWMVPGLLTSDGTDTGTKRSVTQGQLLAAVIEYATFTAADSVNVNTSNVPSVAVHLALQSYPDLYTTSWAKKNDQAIVLALKYDDGTYEFVGGAYPFSAVASVMFNNGSAIDERGLFFQLPSPVSIGGAWVIVSSNAAGRDFSVILYDSDGSTALETIAVDVDQFASTSARLLFVRFTANRNLLANTNYRLTIRPDTASNIILEEFDVSAAAIMDAVEGGQNFHHTSRTDAGAWTQTTTKRPAMGLLLVGL